MLSKEGRFHSIYEKNMPLLRVVAKRRGVPYDEIDDFVQETFLSYYAGYFLKKDSEWTDIQIRSMLVRILTNRCIDYYRFTDAHPSTLMANDELGAEGLSLERGYQQDVLRTIVEREKCEAVITGIGKLKPRLAEVFILHTIQQRSIREVGEMLNISEDACRMRLSRGRKYLTSYIKKWYGEGEITEPGNPENATE